MQILGFEHATISIFRTQKYSILKVENIDDEIMSEMMTENQDLGNEFFPLTTLFPDVDSHLSTAVQVNNVCIGAKIKNRQRLKIRFL